MEKEPGLRLEEEAQPCWSCWMAPCDGSEQPRSPGLHRDYANPFISLNPAFLQHRRGCSKEKGVSGARAKEKELGIIPSVKLG